MSNQETSDKKYKEVIIQNDCCIKIQLNPQGYLEDKYQGIEFILKNTNARSKTIHIEIYEE